ncbi:unnamed protein product [Didymodactylos carnosus]|uniref:Uncharacterized protein n=1 Tax=Didymodactylos carnosus TaxID=1234261 RepID=A0A813VZP5_9BILA|nr:unnamed protein product [Didymodactylos carnosus]CAF3630980.1 unnamed protein product [Didymodactylos carnosus]
MHEKKKKFKFPTKWLLPMTKRDKKSIKEDGKIVVQPVFVSVNQNTDVRTKTPSLPFFAPLSPSPQRSRPRLTKRKNDVLPTDAPSNIRRAVESSIDMSQKYKFNTLVTPKRTEPTIRKLFYSDDDLSLDALKCDTILKILEPSVIKTYPEQDKYIYRSNQNTVLNKSNDMNISNLSNECIIDYPHEINKAPQFEYFNERFNDLTFSMFQMNCSSSSLVNNSDGSPPTLSQTSSTSDQNMVLLDSELNECFNKLLKNTIERPTTTRSVSRETLSTTDGLSLVSYEQPTTVSNNDIHDSGNGSSPISDETENNNPSRHTTPLYCTNSRARSVDSLLRTTENDKTRRYIPNTIKKNTNQMFAKQKSTKSNNNIVFQSRSVQQQKEKQLCTSTFNLEKSGLKRVSATLYKFSPIENKNDDRFLCEQSVDSFSQYQTSMQQLFVEELPQSKNQYQNVVVTSTTNVRSLPKQHRLLSTIKQHVKKCFSDKPSAESLKNLKRQNDKKQSTAPPANLITMQEFSGKLDASICNTVYRGFERETLHTDDEIDN